MEEWEKFLAKAKENFSAARILERRKKYSSAANRAYYAAWQAQLAALQKLKPIRKTRGIYKHRSVVEAFQSRLVGKDKPFGVGMISDISKLASLRVKADYETDDVSARDADDCAKICQRIVEGIRKKLET